MNPVNLVCKEEFLFSLLSLCHFSFFNRTFLTETWNRPETMCATFCPILRCWGRKVKTWILFRLCLHNTREDQKTIEEEGERERENEKRELFSSTILILDRVQIAPLAQLDDSVSFERIEENTYSCTYFVLLRATPTHTLKTIQKNFSRQTPGPQYTKSEIEKEREGERERGQIEKVQIQLSRSNSSKQTHTHTQANQLWSILRAERRKKTASQTVHFRVRSKKSSKEKLNKMKKSRKKERKRDKKSHNRRFKFVDRVIGQRNQKENIQSEYNFFLSHLNSVVVREKRLWFRCRKHWTKTIRGRKRERESDTLKVTQGSESSEQYFRSNRKAQLSNGNDTGEILRFRTEIL